MQILLALCDDGLGRSVKTYLKRCKYQPESVQSRDELMSFLSSRQPDALILDGSLGIPDSSELLKELRSLGMTLPILCVSRVNDASSRMALYDAGADNVLQLPFLMAELNSRLKAILRRADIYRCRNFGLGNIDLHSDYRLTGPGGESRLSNKEYHILEYFLRNPELLVTLDDLRSRFWPAGQSVENTVLWTNMNNLRRKMEAVDSNVTIKTLRGVGYQVKVDGRNATMADM